MSIRVAIGISLGLAAAGCAGAFQTPEAPPTAITAVTAADVPPEVLAAARAAMPQMTVTEAELKVREGRRYYDVEGRLPNGDEIELDMLEGADGWSVVEIQRDIQWASAPEPVRTAANRAGGVSPVRVIESRQTDGRIIYELFAPNRPATPAMEIMWNAGQARVLSETWPH